MADCDGKQLTFRDEPSLFSSRSLVLSNPLDTFTSPPFYCTPSFKTTTLLSAAGIGYPKMYFSIFSRDMNIQIQRFWYILYPRLSQKLLILSPKLKETEHFNFFVFFHRTRKMAYKQKKVYPGFMSNVTLRCSASECYDPITNRAPQCLYSLGKL